MIPLLVPIGLGLLGGYLTKGEQPENFAGGGAMSNTEKLEKELRKLQRDLNSSRLGTYIEGDTSEEQMARNIEREVKLARFNEILKLLREQDSKFGKGGGVKKRLCPVGTEIQTLIFDRDNFTISSAKDWAKRNGFVYGFVDSKENTHRIRQQEPSDFKADSLRTIEITKGVKAVIGCPKKYAQGGGIDDKKPIYEVEFTWEQTDDDDFDSRKIYLNADSVSDAEKKVQQRFSGYKGLKILEVELAS
jgi:hypothetical protein